MVRQPATVYLAAMGIVLEWLLIAVFACPVLAQNLYLNPGYTKMSAGLAPAHNDQSRYAAAWADFDRDGRLDLIYAGRDFSDTPQTHLYRQEANGTFSEVTTNLPDIESAVLLWSDIDADNYPDLFLSGDTGGLNYVTYIYRNEEGTGNFSDIGASISSAGPPPFLAKEAAWCDFDGDNDPDLLISGTSTDIYINDNGSFSPIGAGLTQEPGSVDCGDYDGDGDLDIAHASEGMFTSSFHIYRNNNGAFVESGINIPAVSNNPLVRWGDYDNDGNLDFFLRGVPEGEITTEGRIYLGDGTGQFSLFSTSAGGYNGWLDIDGDGDLDFYGDQMMHLHVDESDDLFTFYPLYGRYMSWADIDGDNDLDYFYSEPDPMGLFGPITDIVKFAPNIWGFVQDADTNPIPDVTINGGALGTTTTDENGWYAFTDLVQQSLYSVAPSLSGWLFDPATSSGTLYSIAPLHFTGTLVHKISGTVTLDGQALSGVLITSNSFGTRTTDAQGRYEFLNVPDGTSYTLTPTKAGHSFTPASATGTLSADAAADFAADACPSDAQKLLPGHCGCGVVDEGGDTDGDGAWDCVDDDDDGDGVSDVQEGLDGSDPRDPGSVLIRLGTQACAEWNGFFGNIWNIMEHDNLSAAILSVATTVYDESGDAGLPQSFTLAGFGQHDVLVHEVAPWRQDAFGQTCSSANGGTVEGVLDGRMVYYKPADEASARPFQFVVSMPLGSGIPGEQWVAFNTFQPSLAANDAADFVANWVQVRSYSAATQTGTLIFFGESGSELEQIPITLPAYGRSDYPAHKYGQTLVGSAAWIPDDRSSRFSLRNMRYYYDNSALEERFVAAAAVEGTAAAGRPLALPLDTTDGSEVIEIVNALNHTQLVTVLVYDAAGAEAAQIAFDLAAHATRHVIVDSLLVAQASTRGLAVVQGGSAAGIAAAALKYGRTAEMGINYAYSSPLREALGASLRTSYNTFLGQGCLMLAGNTTASSQTLLLSMQRTDGTAVLAGLELTIPAHGTIAYDICSHESSEQYGAITVTPALANTLTASLIRTGAGNTYRFALQAR